MVKYLHCFLWLIIFFTSCTEQPENIAPNPISSIEVTEQGVIIDFKDLESSAFFKTSPTSLTQLQGQLFAPGKIVATVFPSQEGAAQNIILFDQSDLSENYTLLIQQHIIINQIENISIKQREIELDRITDLYNHGAATGQELLAVQTDLSIERANLANAKIALIEHETKLKLAGFDAKTLRNIQPGLAFLIFDIPENHLPLIKLNQNCTIQFSAFPDEIFTGKIQSVVDLIDSSTRMVKIRVVLNNAGNKLKSGMFATIAYGMTDQNYLNIDKNAIVTIQGRHYVFVKISPTQFERKEIKIGQQIGDRVVVISGLEHNEHTAVEGVMQLKGLSFGY
jgi:membrane fusion protein, heavy metal efflux system